MEKEQRGQWASSFGFLMAAVGSAVGLGNLWGFPYKMGANGGFAFLLVYLVLAVMVGFVVMLGEFVIGRKTGKSVWQAYSTLNKNFTFLGIMGTVVPYLILSFYCVLGGYVMKYAVANLGDLFGASWGVGSTASGDFFGGFMTNQTEGVVYALIFIALTALVVVGGVSGGIEKFSKIAMPALFVMLLIVIIRAVTLPGAGEGLEFMFKPNFEPFKDGGWASVVTTAAGQMFFSLSLAMGIMVTFGSYLPKSENLIKQSIIIPAADTTVAIMAGLAVLPAAFALGGADAALSGPKLLFVTLQNVFAAMGSFGPFFGFLFYLLVFIAAITSSISLFEVTTSVFIDRAESKGKNPNRKKATIINAVVIAALAFVVALDGLGSNGVWVPFQSFFTETIPVWCDCWLDLMDCISEGILMPVGALCMSLIVGWKLGPKFLEDEITQCGNKFSAEKFIMFCFRFAAPVLLLVVLYGQLVSFGILK
ncbi:MAG TPA: sodium-dependent transporter [Anaerovoracaceae bacterium]|nr:sodium-dependent transporter [Anaerovoracaceae bacterium]